MAEVANFKAGEFCWFELATTDTKSAKNFYSNLFGWSINDMDMGNGEHYTMLEKNGKTVGALFRMDAQQSAGGVPPHWNTYIATNDADGAAKKAADLGGTVVVPPFDVMEFGRMTVVQDPTGAMISLWQPKLHTGAQVIDEPNTFCWYELNTRDTNAAKNFYTGLLGWSTGGSPEYTEWKNNDRSIGGMMAIQPEWGPVPPSWTNYVMVENVDASVARAKELGGNVMTGPMDIPGTGRFAVVQDPQGAVFAMFQPQAK